MQETEELRRHLEEQFEQIWTTEEMVLEFEPKGFMAPVVAVVRKSDGVKGTLRFTHMPRFYFDFREV